MYVQVGFLFSNFEDFFLSPCSWNKYFSRLCVVSNAIDVSNKNASGEKKKKHYDLRLRDPDDAEQLK